MRQTLKPKEKLETTEPSSKRGHLELVKNKEEKIPIDYFKVFEGEKVVVFGNRWLKIESVNKKLGIKVLYGIGGETIKEEVSENDEQLEKLKNLIELGIKNNADKGKEENKEEAKKSKPKKTARRKPKLKLVVNNDNNVSEKQETEKPEADLMDISKEEIDPEKRNPENIEKWTEKVRGVKTIPELCDVIDEIGFTKVNQEIVHPAAMRVRLEVLEQFSSEGLIKWKIEEITEEFGIREKAMKIKMKERGMASENVVSLDREREEKSKKKVDLRKLKEELDEAEKKYNEMLDKIKNLKGFFKMSAISLEKSESAFEKETQDFKKRYEEKKRAYEEASLEENSTEELKQVA